MSEITSRIPPDSMALEFCQNISTSDLHYWIREYEQRGAGEKKWGTASPEEMKAWAKLYRIALLARLLER